MPPPSENKTTHWQAESLRLSVFLVPNVQPKGEGWWTKLSGTDPESRNAKPNRGELLEAGSIQGNTLTLSIQPGRVDWFLSPNVSSEEEIVGVKSIGRFEGAVETFSTMMLKWLNECPATVRLAYGAVLLEPVESKENGYLRLGEFVRAITIDLKSEDLFYQINRPRESTTLKDMRLNRLSKWSVASFQAMRFSFGIAQNKPTQPLAYLHGDTPAMACRAELDLSTSANPVELPHDMLAPLFNELVGLGSEIAERGDIP